MKQIAFAVAIALVPIPAIAQYGSPLAQVDYRVTGQG
jgi:hypothetical protein